MCATSQRKNGAPISAVSTPIGSVRPSGAARAARSAAVKQQRADQRRGQQGAAGMALRQPSREDRRDEADEADRPANGDAGADSQRGEADDLKPQPADIVAERLGDILAEGEPIERQSEAQQQADGDRRRDRRERGLGEAAVDQRAHQPVIGVVESEGGGGQSERQGGERAGERADREARKQEGRGLGARPGEREQQRERAERADDRSDRQGDRRREAEQIGGDDRAQSRAAGRAGEVGRGERVGEQGLDRRAGRAQGRAVDQRQRRARQAQLDQQGGGELAVLLEQAGQRRPGQQQRGEEPDQDEEPEQERADHRAISARNRSISAMSSGPMQVQRRPSVASMRAPRTRRATGWASQRWAPEYCPWR